MKTSRWSPMVWITIVGLLGSGLVGCVTHGADSIALDFGEKPPEGEVLVFGRFCRVDEDGDEFDFGAPIHVNAVLTGYRREHELVVSSITYGGSTHQCLEGDGTFFWHLLPGSYQISWYRRISGGTYLAIAIAADFDVPEGGRPVYIGTCRYKVLEGRTVHNERNKASARLAEQFPEVAGAQRVSLMHLRDLSR